MPFKDFFYLVIILVSCKTLSEYFYALLHIYVEGNFIKSLNVYFALVFLKTCNSSVGPLQCMQTTQAWNKNSFYLRQFCDKIAHPYNQCKDSLSALFSDLNNDKVI